MRALRAPNRAQRILWRISRDLNEAAPIERRGSPFSDEWPNRTQTLTLTGTLTLALTQSTRYTHSSVSSVLRDRSLDTVVRAVKWAYNPNHSPNLDASPQGIYFLKLPNGILQPIDPYCNPYCNPKCCKLLCLRFAK